MYSSGVLVSDVPKVQQEGILAHAAWIKPDTSRYQGQLAVGEAVFRAECLRCHEAHEGYNAMAPLVTHWNPPLILSALDHLDKLKGFMPPFLGTEEEKQALAGYLMTLTAAGAKADCTAVATDSLKVIPADSLDAHGREEAALP